MRSGLAGIQPAERSEVAHRPRRRQNPRPVDVSEEPGVYRCRLELCRAHRRIRATRYVAVAVEQADQESRARPRHRQSVGKWTRADLRCRKGPPCNSDLPTIPAAKLDDLPAPTSPEESEPGNGIREAGKHLHVVVPGHSQHRDAGFPSRRFSMNRSTVTPAGGQLPWASMEAPTDPRSSIICKDCSAASNRSHTGKFDENRLRRLALRVWRARNRSVRETVNRRERIS